MNRLFVTAFVLAAGFACYLSYNAGYRDGVEDCPENAAALKAKADADAAFWQRMELPPSPREEVCDVIFDAVGDVLSDEYRHDQEDRYGSPVGR